MATPVRPSVDIHVVARKAGVSTATVSRVMNHVSTVDARLAARVNKAAAELCYTPNTQARALVLGKSGLLGLIVSEITNPFFPELIQSFELAAVERGYEILLGSTNYAPARMAQCVRRMVERKVEGVAVMTFGMDEDLLQELSGRAIPLVSVGSTQTIDAAVSIEVNYRQGIEEAVQHLAGMGHRAIALISGPLHLRGAELRRVAFVEAMAAIGLSPSGSHLVEGDHTMEGGLRAARQLFGSTPVPTAILCSNDMTAIGVLHAASACGLGVPEDLSVIGFDDIHMARFTVPPLTSVRMAPADLARAALDALPLRPLRTASGPVETGTVIPTHLVVRQTTGSPRRRGGRASGTWLRGKRMGRAEAAVSCGPEKPG